MEGFCHRFGWYWLNIEHTQPLFDMLGNNALHVNVSLVAYHISVVEDTLLHFMLDHGGFGVAKVYQQVKEASIEVAVPKMI